VIKSALFFLLISVSYGMMERPAERIIALSPDATELLFSIGAGGNIVGTVEQADYPLEAKKIKRVGQYPDPDLELIVQLRPDLIVMPLSGSSYGLYEKLKQLKLPVYITNPKKISDIAKEMILLGKLTGKEIEANKKAKDFLEQLNQVKPAKKRTVFYELWDTPLMTVGDGTMIDEAIRRCGGENIFGKEKIKYPRISKASVLQKNPEVIIVAEKRMIQDWQKWPALSALKRNKIVYLDSDNIQRESPRILDGIQAFCEQIS
jgi:ABC-type Fe3+-hydroxamate transport system substrate-binding protein